MTTGRFRDGLPHVTLNLLKQNGDEVAVDFVLDTGFDGDLALPAHVVQQLSDAVQGSQFVNLAGGFQRRCPCYEIIWEDDEGEARTLEVLVMDGNPLMGTAFLRNHLLTIELLEGGEVLAEPL